MGDSAKARSGYKFCAYDVLFFIEILLVSYIGIGGSCDCGVEYSDHSPKRVVYVVW